MSPTALMLGRTKRVVDKRDLKLVNYLAAVPDPPTTFDPKPKTTKWSMALNDQLGDCVPAGADHLVQFWTLITQGHKAAFSDAAVLKRFEQVGGYVPGDPSTDNGCNMRDFLKFWLANPYNGHHLTAFVGVDTPASYASSKTFQQAIWLFGGLYIGLDLPLSAQSQVASGKWSVVKGQTAKPGSWGGHCVPIVAYSDAGLTCITWGRRLLMTWDFLAAYGDENYALLSPDWLKDGKTLAGFDLPTLRIDLKAVQAA